MSRRKIEDFLEHEGEEIPIQIFIEKRSSHRVGFGKKGLIIRISSYCNAKEITYQIEKFKTWAKEYLQNNKLLLQQRRNLKYKNEDTIVLFGYTYTISINKIEGEDSHAKYISDEKKFNLYISELANEIQTQRIARFLLLQLIKKTMLPYVAERVKQINYHYFKKNIKGVYLRDKTSSWGSCSRDNRINLSIGLLKAPLDVIDYVIVHELAHLVEFNHSDAFWNVVATAMPQYQEKEKWLKENAHVCRI